jgi:DNA polymerase I-like protein with 3'-5' exonuclease and polymerase domains
MEKNEMETVSQETCVNTFKTEKEDINTRMQKALDLIARGMGIEKACREARISTKTFYKLKSQPEWAEKYENARKMGFVASGVELEKAEELAKMEKEGIRIEKPHLEKAIEPSFYRFLIDEQGEKRINHELDEIFTCMEKAFEIVQDGKSRPFWNLWDLPQRFEQLYDMLWAIQNSLNRIKQVLELFEKAKQEEQTQEPYPQSPG